MNVSLQIFNMIVPYMWLLYDIWFVVWVVQTNIIKLLHVFIKMKKGIKCIWNKGCIELWLHLTYKNLMLVFLDWVPESNTANLVKHNFIAQTCQWCMMVSQRNTYHQWQGRAMAEAWLQTALLSWFCQTLQNFDFFPRPF